MLTIESVLLLCLYVFILLGIFFGDNAITNTFTNTAPALSAQIERSINIPTNEAFGGVVNSGFSEPTNNP